MKFSIYDILSNIIPGAFVLIFSSLLFNFVLQDLDMTVILVLSYIIGFLNNTISSWLEDFYYLTWGGKPSIQLLNSKDIWKVKFYESAKTKEYLTKEAANSSLSEDGLFQIAMRYANNSSNERVKEFNSVYALSRNLLTAFIISAVIVISYYWCNWWFFGLSLLIITVVWLRAKQRGYYYAREVLTTYLNIKEKQVETTK